MECQSPLQIWGPQKDLFKGMRTATPEALQKCWKGRMPILLCILVLSICDAALLKGLEKEGVRGFSLYKMLISISCCSCYDVPGLMAPITQASNPAGSRALADTAAFRGVWRAPREGTPSSVPPLVPEMNHFLLNPPGEGASIMSFIFAVMSYPAMLKI